MRLLISALLLAATGCVYSREVVERRPVLTVEDVVRMHEAGVDQVTQLSRISASQLSRPLTADDVIRLKNAHVPDPVIQAMAEAAPEPVTVVERPYYVAPRVGFYDPYPYRYGWRAYPRYSYYPYYRARPRTYHRPR